MDNNVKNGPSLEISPLVEGWIVRVLSTEQWDSLGRDPLVALPLVEAKADEAVSDEVLAAWQRTVASYRRHVDQAEFALVTRMRQQGKTWGDVAHLLGLPDEVAAEQYHEQLKAELNSRPFFATHPETPLAR